MLDPERLYCPDREVTVAPALIASASAFWKHTFPQRIAFVRRTTKRLHGRHVFVQRPVGRRQFATVERHGAGCASQITPVRIDWIEV